MNTMNTREFFEAVDAGLTRTVEAMLKKGMPVDAADADGRTALHRVYSRNPKSAMSQLLLRSGADPHRPDLLGSTPQSEAELAGTFRVPNLRPAPPLAHLPRAKPWKGKRKPIRIGELLRWTPVLAMCLVLVYFVMNPPNAQFSSKVQPYVPIWPRNWNNAQRAWNDKNWSSAAAYCQAALDCDRKYDGEKTPVKIMAVKAYAKSGEPQKARNVYKTLPFLGWDRQNELQRLIAASSQAKLDGILDKAEAARARSERLTAESLVHSAERFCKEMGVSDGRVVAVKRQLAADKARADEVLFAKRQESARKRQEERMRRRRSYYTNSYRYTYPVEPVRTYGRNSDGLTYPQALPRYRPSLPYNLTQGGATRVPPGPPAHLTQGGAGRVPPAYPSAPRY